MANIQCKQNQAHIVISLHHVATPDSNARLSRAVDILLRAAVKKSTLQPKREPDTQNQRPPAQAPTEFKLNGNDRDHSSPR